MKFVMDERLKHRLTVVVVILAIAAIFVPAVMKKSNQHFEEKLSLSVRLPPKPLLPNVVIKEKKTMFQSVKVAHVDIPAVVQLPRLTQFAKAEPLSIKSTMPAAPLINNRPTLARADLVVRHAVKAAAAPKKLANAIHLKKEVYSVQLGYKASYNKFNGKQGQYYKVIVGELNQKNAAIILQKKLALSMRLNGFIIKTDVS